MIPRSSEHATRFRCPVTANDLAARYDAAAARWHATMQWLGYPYAYARLLDELRRKGVLPGRLPSPRVLDCGLGTGVLAAAFAPAVPGVTTIAGVDLSPAMLRHAAGNLAATGVTLELQRADARCLPYRVGEFGAVLSAHMLEHLPDPHVALREMSRVLEPGGLLIVVAVRTTLADAVIRLKWGHAPIDPGDLARWMTLEGIRDVYSYALGSAGTPAQWLSRAFVGRKAASDPHAETASAAGPVT